MKNILNYKLLGLSILSLFVLSCSEEDPVAVSPPDAVGFHETQATLEVTEDYTYQIKLESAGVSNQDRTFTVLVNPELTDADPEMYSFNSAVTIPAGEHIGYTDLTFDYNLLNFGDSRTLSLVLDSATVALPNNSRRTSEIQFIKFCTLNDVIIELVTDDWAEETSWEVYKLPDTSTPVASGGEDEAYDDFDNSTITEKLCLDSGDYAIVVYDSYGDGIVNGGFSVFVNGEAVASGPVSGTYGLGYFSIP